MKVIDASKESVLRLATNEVDFLSRCDNEHIVAYKEMYLFNYKVVIVMELCDSENLGDFIEMKQTEGRHFSEGEVKYFLKQIVDGLSEIHENGIIHRDLKP